MYSLFEKLLLNIIVKPQNKSILLNACVIQI